MKRRWLWGASRRAWGTLAIAGMMLNPPGARAQVSAPSPAPVPDLVTVPVTGPVPGPVVGLAIGAEAPESWWGGVSTDGFLSLSYTNNFDDPINRQNQFRVFDFNDDNPQVDVAQFVVQRAVATPNQFGFRFDLIAGSGVPEVTAAYGMFRGMTTGIAHQVDIPEVFISYIAPAGKGLRFDLGKFVTHMGYEVIGGYDGYNDNFSRSFIFGYGIPFTQTGLRMSYSFSSRISAMVSGTDGWDTVQRFNHGYTLGAQLALTPTKATGISLNFIQGPERRCDSHDQRSVSEIVGTWKPVPKLALAGDSLYGREENAMGVGHDAIWRGLAGYTRYYFTKRFSLAFRGEIFNDDGGTRTGVDQTLRGFTLTPEFDAGAKLSHLNSHFKKADGKFAIRGEARLDLSNKDVFLEGANPTRKSQFTSAVNLIYLF